MKNNKGFTLVEVLIAMLITGIIFTSVYFLFIKVFTMNKEQNDFIQMQDAMRNVAHIVEKDIRKSTQNIEFVEAGNEIKIYYLDYSLNRMLDDTGNEIKITYKLSDDVLYRNGNYLMNNLDNFELTYEEVRLYVELKLNSKTDKREVKHDKKIYLRKNQQ